MSDNTVVLVKDFYIFKCPHCDLYTQVHKNEINCLIFRHAAFKTNMLPINPHAPKEVCDNLLETQQVYGCAKPFILIKGDKDYFTVDICGYI